MKAFVINLKRSPHRLANISEQLNKLGIEFEVIEATDGSLLTESDIDKLYDKDMSLKYIKQPLTLGEIGCADSHLRVYETIVSQNLPYALVLEDDVELNTNIKTVLTDEFVKSKKFDWLQIDYGVTGPAYIHNWLRASWIETKKNSWFFIYALVKFPFIFALAMYDFLRELVLKNNPKIVTFARPLYLASTYVITQAGAKKLLTYGRPIRFAADMLPNKARVQASFDMKAVCPPFAHQDKQFNSDIGVR